MKAINESVSAHALLSPSSAYRWMACPGSVELTRDMPDTTSVFAEEGIRAHETASKCFEVSKSNALTGIKEPLDVDKTISHEMENAIRVYLGYVAQFAQSRRVKVYIEEKLKYSEDLYGTPDCVAYNKETDELLVCDFKFGQGTFVRAEENQQLLIYAMLFIHEKNNERYPGALKLSIVQPRHHAPEKIREWTPHIAHLYDFCVQLKDAAEATYLPDAPRIPGPHCQFCKGKSECKEFTSLARDKAYDDLTLASVVHPDMEGKDVAERLNELPNIKQYIKALETQALGIAYRGVRIPGYKLVEAITRARVADAEAMQTYLEGCGIAKDDIYETKMAGITKLRKLVSSSDVNKKEKTRLNDFLEHPKGREILVSSADKRPEVSANIPIEEAFAETPSLEDLQ